jgi:hypothetical protein
MTTTTTTDTNPFNSLRIPSGKSETPSSDLKKHAALFGKDSASGKAYAKQSKQNRFVTKLSVDPATCEALIDVQYLTELQLNGKQPTRTTIIRRALRLYTRQILQAKKDGRTQILELERIELKKLTSNRQAAPLGEVAPCL